MLTEAAAMGLVSLRIPRPAAGRLAQAANELPGTEARRVCLGEPLSCVKTPRGAERAAVRWTRRRGAEFVRLVVSVPAETSGA